jgi:hypothetical protein
MRGGKKRSGAAGGPGPWAERRVEFSRGYWQREEQASAARSAGWWEAVTVTWSPAATPVGDTGRRAATRSPLLGRALATMVDTIGPPVAELVAAGTLRLLDRWREARAVGPSGRRQLPAPARALSRPKGG